MSGRNDAFQNGLRCLGSPWTLLCIAILVFNDHYLKAFHPSWLTGKLSDFAGLYFFPFIVAAVVGVVFVGLGSSSRKTGLIAFGGVAIWFLLLKTFSPVNSLTIGVISALTGRPVQLILDPSDTVALLALVPAWREWTSAMPVRNRARSYASLVFGIAACLATSPLPAVVESVTHLSREGDVIFALDAKVSYTAAMSNDAGKTWGWVEMPYEVTIPDALRPLPIMACLPGDQDQCYRISGAPRVESSPDGGKTWEVSWELHEDRIPFMKKMDAGLEIGTYDLLIMNWENGTYVLVAMGREGILRRELPEGEWERISVQNAGPTPYRSADVIDAVAAMKWELIVWFLLSLVAFMIACWLVWSAASRSAVAPLSKVDWIYSPALSPIYGLAAVFLVELAILFLLSIFTQVVSRNAFPYGFDEILLVVAGVCALLSLAVWPAIVVNSIDRWRRRLLEQGAAGETARGIVLTAYATHLGFLAAGSIPWLMWAMGTISNYIVALSLAVLASLVTAYVLLRYLHGISNAPNTFSGQSNRNPEQSAH